MTNIDKYFGLFILFSLLIIKDTTFNRGEVRPKLNPGHVLLFFSLFYEMEIPGFSFFSFFSFFACFFSFVVFAGLFLPLFLVFLPLLMIFLSYD